MQHTLNNSTIQETIENIRVIESLSLRVFEFLLNDLILKDLFEILRYSKYRVLELSIESVAYSSVWAR